MVRVLPLRILCLAVVFSSVSLIQAQSYSSPDAAFCSPDYSTPSETLFSLSGGGTGKVSFQDLHITSPRAPLSLDPAPQAVDFSFDCSAKWSFGAANPATSGVGTGKMSMTLQYLGVDKDGSTHFGGQLNDFSCSMRSGGGRNSIRVLRTAGLDSFVRFSYTPEVPNSLQFHPMVSGFQIDSSFDSFLDASVDGGSTWTTSDGAAHFQGTPEPASMAALGFGVVALLRRKSRTV